MEITTISKKTFDEIDDLADRVNIYGVVNITDRERSNAVRYLVVEQHYIFTCNNGPHKLTLLFAPTNETRQVTKWELKI